MRFPLLQEHAPRRVSSPLRDGEDVHDRDTRVTASAYGVRRGVKARCADLGCYYYNIISIIIINNITESNQIPHLYLYFATV